MYDYEVFWSIQFIVCHVLTTNPRTPFWKPGLRIWDLQKILFFQQKNIVVEIFSRSDKTLKVAKNLWFRFYCLIIFVALMSHQQPMNEWNLESSLLSNFFMRKDFRVQMLRKSRKNLPFNNLYSFVLCNKHILSYLQNGRFKICQLNISTVSVVKLDNATLILNIHVAYHFLGKHRLWNLLLPAWSHGLLVLFKGYSK